MDLTVNFLKILHRNSKFSRNECCSKFRDVQLFFLPLFHLRLSFWIISQILLVSFKAFLQTQIFLKQSCNNLKNFPTWKLLYFWNPTTFVLVKALFELYFWSYAHFLFNCILEYYLIYSFVRIETYTPYIYIYIY